MAAPNHFLSVSRAGVLHARRRGEPPVAITRGAEGLEVAVPPGRLAAPTILVHFDYQRATPRRSVHVTDVTINGVRRPIEAFLADHEVTEGELGAWMRAAVEAALDRAALARA
ncbi:MAG: hypothetical protein R3B09_14225 [Nannocystaceae bacterium]